MIRLAQQSDAEAIMDIKKEIILLEKTSKFFITSPNELSNDINLEKERIQESREKNNLFVVYEVEKAVVGFMVFRRYDLTRLHHAGSLGMGIRNAYTNQGIGTKLLEYLINWANQQEGLEKICLGVTSSNQRAIHVYKHIGFIEEGVQRKQVKYEDGTYGDDILMAYYI